LCRGCLLIRGRLVSENGHGVCGGCGGVGGGVLGRCGLLSRGLLLSENGHGGCGGGGHGDGVGVGGGVAGGSDGGDGVVCRVVVVTSNLVVCESVHCGGCGGVGVWWCLWWCWWLCSGSLCLSESLSFSE